MIHIYLCDDEEAVLHQIQTALEWKIFMENYDMKVVCAAGCAQALLEAVEDNRRSVYFLDVDLKDGEWDGFRLGRELRRRDPHGTLVYITSYGDLAWRTFQYHLEAFDYIIKEPEQIGPAASRCLEEILFFETASTPHHVLLHTAGSRMDFLGSLNELESQMGPQFIRTHRAYLVAADKIEAVDIKRSKLWVGGRECLLSRAGKAALRKRTGEGQ